MDNPKYSDIEIDWVGEVLAQIGYGLQARRILKPLIEGGAKVKLIPAEDYIPEDRRIKDPYWIRKVEKSKAMPDSPIRINFSLPNLYRPNPKALNIGYTMWETTSYPREWTPLINKMNYFFVGSKSLVKSALNAGVTVPIEVVEATIDVNEWAVDGPKVSISEIPDDHIKFLFVGNWIPRKNYEDLILGYLAAFDGVQDVCLVIKTWSNNPTAEGIKHIEEGIRFISGKISGVRKPRITLITDMLSEEQVISLMRSCQVYTTVSHGEGFDLPVVQAMCVGNLVVATGFMAHGDYLDYRNSIQVKYSLCPVTGASSPLYDGYQMWSRPDMDSFIASLRQAYELIKSKSQMDLTTQARKDIHTLFNPEANTARIATILRSIRCEQASKNTANKLATAVTA